LHEVLFVARGVADVIAILVALPPEEPGNLVVGRTGIVGPV